MHKTFGQREISCRETAERLRKVNGLLSGIPLPKPEIDVPNTERKQTLEAQPETAEPHRERLRNSAKYQFGGFGKKIVAFGLTMAVFILYLKFHRSISFSAGIGFFWGVFATYFIGFLGMSAMTEGWLASAMMGLIWIGYGSTALGTAMLSWLIYTVILFATFALENRILNRKK